MKDDLQKRIEALRKKRSDKKTPVVAEVSGRISCQLLQIFSDSEFSDSEIAELVGVQISRFRRGKGTLTLSSIDKLSDLFGFDLVLSAPDPEEE